jgi:hexosaminidase
LIGWDEILEGGLAPGATVMSWRGTKGGIAAAQAGHDVVMTPTQFVYFDYYQSKDTANEPLAIGGFVPLEKVYSFEPVPAELSAEQAKHVLGGQANIWTEYMPDARHVQYMAFPRLLALAEVVWSPKEKKDFADFSRRLDAEERRLKTLEVNFRPRENKATTGQ